MYNDDKGSPYFSGHYYDDLNSATSSAPDPAAETQNTVNGEYHFSGRAANREEPPVYENSAWSDPVINDIGSDRDSFYSPNFHSENDYTSEPAKKKRKRERKPRKSGFTFGKAVALVLACALVSGLVCEAIVVSSFKRLEASLPKDTGAQTQVVIGSSKDASADVKSPSFISAGKTLTANEVYQLGCEQVVGVKTSVVTQNFFGQETSGAVSGTGFIISEDGYIITNYHVIEYSAIYGYEITVMMHNNDTYTARIVGYNDANDVAVLKIEASGLNPVTFGDSDDIQVGETVYAIGNPLGELLFSMTTGSVSALDRLISTEVSSSINMFQIDAAINSGNSGGPIYNSRGEVIGIATAKNSSAMNEGLGFAIPINDAVSIAQKVIETGGVLSNAYLGITPQDIESYVIQYYGIPEGVYVYAVSEGFCAEKAGIKPGDIILSIGGKSVTSVAALKSTLKTLPVGETVEVEIYRSGKNLTFNVTLDEAPENTQPIPMNQLG